MRTQREIEVFFERIAEAAKDGLQGSDLYAKDRLVLIRKLANQGHRALNEK